MSSRIDSMFKFFISKERLKNTVNPIRPPVTPPTPPKAKRNGTVTHQGINPRPLLPGEFLLKPSPTLETEMVRAVFSQFMKSQIQYVSLVHSDGLITLTFKRIENDKPL